MQGKTGPRALPETLPEWRYVDTRARFWGLRHFDRTQMDKDPSSPFGGPKAWNWPDDQAIGLVFSFDPASGKRPILTYLSGDTSVVGKAERSPLSFPREAEMHLNVSYQQLSPDAVQSSYDMKGPGGVFWLTLILSGMLGHGIFL
jgi:hypothetical protein